MSMTRGLDCPVCKEKIIEGIESGAKVTCPVCDSVHRVRGEGADLQLHVLIENLDWAAPQAGPGPDSIEQKPEAVGPKLTTWKDRARTETTSRPAAGRRATTRRRGR